MESMERQIYKTVNGRDLAVDVFAGPRRDQEVRRPAIALFHGGGWVFGSPAEFHGACRRYAGKGFVTFSFEYRRSMRPDGTYPHPDITPVESVKDARSAMRWLRANSDAFGIDPDRIVAAGQSAGGQLALGTALLDGIDETSDDSSVSPIPSAILLYASCVNTVEAWMDSLLGERREEIWSISPFHNLHGGMPPVLQFHGRDDPTVAPYMVEFFARRMRELGNHHELEWLPDRKHLLGEGSPQYAEYFDEGILERTDDFLVRMGFMTAREVADGGAPA